jgi:hypothetical protein
LCQRALKTKQQYHDSMLSDLTDFFIVIHLAIASQLLP